MNFPSSTLFLFTSEYVARSKPLARYMSSPKSLTLYPAFISLLLTLVASDIVEPSGNNASITIFVSFVVGSPSS